MKQSYVIAIVVFLLVLAGIVFFGLSGEKDMTQDQMPITEEPTDERPATTITAKHQYKDGTHIIAGETDMPTPCHLLEWRTDIAESLPEQVMIDFSLTTQAETCLQVITPARFKIEFQASEEASIEAMLNGRPIVLNLIEADPGEDLDDFELFIKG